MISKSILYESQVKECSANYNMNIGVLINGDKPNPKSTPFCFRGWHVGRMKIIDDGEDNFFPDTF